MREHEARLDGLASLERAVDQAAMKKARRRPPVRPGHRSGTFEQQLRVFSRRVRSAGFPPGWTQLLQPPLALDGDIEMQRLDAATADLSIAANGV